MAEGEPLGKKLKTQKIEIDPIFLNFLKDRNKRNDLDSALQAIKLGLSKMNLCIVKIVEANARSSVSFKRASLNAEIYKDDPDDPFSKDATFITGNIFIDGIDVVEKFLDDSNPKVMKIPQDQQCRDALSKLLKFISTKNHGALFEENTCEKDWAVKVAQHLLSKLSVYSNYVIEQYPGLRGNLCPCQEHDELAGKVGDTSFGCEKGWHGSCDVIMEDLPISVVNDTEIPETEDLSVSSVEVNSSLTFSERAERDKNQLLAQTIVFSFLQHKVKKKLNNYLIPGVGISSKYLTVYFYDSENDVLLESCCLELFSGTTTLTYSVVVFLWLTLNYRIFCTGITDEMKMLKADFFKRVDDHLHIYMNEVTRPMHKQRETSKDDSSWANNPGKRCKTKAPSVNYLCLPLDFG